MLRTAKKVWSFFPIAERRKLAGIVVMMVVAAGLEVLGVGALLPVVGLLQQSNAHEKSAFISSMYGLLGNPTPEHFFTLVLLLLLSIFIAKNLFILLLGMFQYELFAREQSKMSIKLLSSYLHRPFTFHLQVNTADLIRNVHTEVSNVFNQSVIPLAALIAEAMVVIALLLLIVAADPLAASMTFAAGGAVVYGVSTLLRGRLVRTGKKIQSAGARFTQYIQEGLGGIKEIKVFGREAFFISAFSEQMNLYAEGYKEYNVIGLLPRLVLETLFVVIFVSLLMGLMFVGRLSEALPLVAIYGAATFRLIPSINKIMSAINGLNVGRASIDLVSRELALTAEGVPQRASAYAREPLREIELRSVNYTYPESEQSALCGISLSIKAGEMIGFIGKSGSGKTTLIDTVLGLLTPTSGAVLVNGKNIQHDVASWQSQIGYIPQSIYLTDDTLRRNVAFGLPDEDISEEGLWVALEAAQLASFVRSLPGGLDTVVGERGVRLSGGQRQRIGIARAMYYDPPVLILDEATSAVDSATESEIVNTISKLQRKKTILIIAHRLTTVENCDRIFLLREGEVVASGSFADVVTVMNVQ